MFALLLLAASVDVVAQDRSQFETFWREQIQSSEPPTMSKEATWVFYEWAQAQFSLGYCSQYIPADAAERMRRLPNEAELMETKMGRELVTGFNENFRAGMQFRSEVKPSLRACEEELRGRGITLRAMK